jgi:hypothetical protein
MFPTGGKKRGCAFENPEPSSPKVTCIGQVRVKTKKQGKKIRTRSKRISGEASFRRAEQQNTSVVTHQDLNMNIQNNPNSQEHRNQRWVHLPITICEALRAFGAEFNCFLPCRSSCITGESEKEEKAAARSDGGENGSGSSCGAVFARWLVAMQESEGKGREMELVVGEGEEDQRVTERSHSLRRMEVFEEANEIKEEMNEVLEDEEARVSICIPPKNALLLMRCRSDPVKMAALANRFWESPVQKVEDERDGQDEDEKEEHANVEVGEERQRELEVETEVKGDEICETDSEEEEEEANLVTEEEDEDVEENPEVTDELQVHPVEQEEEDEEEEEMNPEVPAEETPLSCSSPEAFVDPENSEMEQSVPKLVQENEYVPEDEPEALYKEEEEEEEPEDAKEASFFSSSLVPVQSEQETEAEEEANGGALAEEIEEKETPERPREDEETATHQRSEPECPKYNEWDPGLESKIQESDAKRERDSSVLPDCLLLMMCEPKLSMEVSRETWVCRTDFIRCLPERPVKKTNGGDEVKKRVSTEDSNPAHQLLQPPRSSCSFPVAAAAAGAGASMASMIEQKLSGAKGCEPFVLTRCKSEPMRSASKLAPEACFWKNRKLEPHHPGTLGMGAAGVGF